MWQAMGDLLFQAHWPVELCRRLAENPEGTQCPLHPHYPAGHCQRFPKQWSSNNTHGCEGNSMAEKVIQRTKHSSPLHSKGWFNTLSTFLLPFTLLNLPYRHHSVCRPSKHPAQHHSTKSKEASSLAQHICRRISVVTQGNCRLIKAEYPRKDACSQASCTLKARVSEA